MIDVEIGGCKESVSYSEMCLVVGYRIMNSISFLSKLHFFKNDFHFTTPLHESLVIQCLENVDNKDEYRKLLNAIAYITCISKVVNWNPHSNWYYHILKLKSDSLIIRRAKKIVVRYRPLFYYRMMREYELDPENYHEFWEYIIFFFLFFGVILIFYISKQL